MHREEGEGSSVYSEAKGPTSISGGRRGALGRKAQGEKDFVLQLVTPLSLPRLARPYSLTCTCTRTVTAPATSSPRRERAPASASGRNMLLTLLRALCGPDRGLRKMAREENPRSLLPCEENLFVVRAGEVVIGKGVAGTILLRL